MTAGGDVAEALPAAALFARRLARVIFYVALPLALLTTSVRFAFSEERLYEYSIDHYDVTSVTNISHADLIAATQDIRAYFSNTEDYLRTLVHDQSGRVVPLFNPREVLHMRDVKDLVRKFYGLEDFALCYVAAYV
ncbi:MAG: lipoprotein intramolecular transacylase Lit, partial [Dehalococcoidia bacterium]